MLTLILATSLFLGPAEEVANERGATPVEFVARITDERFVAVNSSGEAQVLLFTDIGGGRTARALVAAGSEIAFDFPAGTLHNLLLRVVTAKNGSVSTSAEYDLGALAAGNYEFVWLESQAQFMTAWGMSPAGPSHLPSTTEPTMQAASAPHVPVITPTDKPNGDLPPRIEEQPLPPV